MSSIHIVFVIHIAILIAGIILVIYGNVAASESAFWISGTVILVVGSISMCCTILCWMLVIWIGTMTRSDYD